MPSGGKTRTGDPGKALAKRGVAAPATKPRILVKFRGQVELDYLDGAETQLVSSPDWQPVTSHWPDIHLYRLFTALSPTKITGFMLRAEIVSGGAFKAPNLLRWFRAEADGADP